MGERGFFMECLYEMWMQNCSNLAEKPALVLDEKEVTYKEMRSRELEWKEYFEKIGIQTGQRVVIISNDRYDFMPVWFALWGIEAIPIPLEPTITSAELERAIQASKPHWILSENKEHFDTLEKLGEVIQVEPQTEWRGVKLEDSGVKTLAKTAFFVYTSGTTGTPKCVMYGFDATEATVNSLKEAYQMTSDDIVLTPLTPSLPATLFTVILPTLIIGGTLVLPSKPIPGRVLKLLYSYKVTILFAVPYFYSLLIEAMKIRGVKENSLRLCLSTSAFMPEKVFEEFYEITKLPTKSIYCTSEAMYCTFNTSTDFEIQKKSVGTVQEGVKIKIVDSNMNEVKPGVEGQILISGTHMSMGYFEREELQKEVYKNGWVHTGDLGYMNENGELYIRGRLSETINVSGYLVNPQEVEQIILNYDNIKEVMITAENEDLRGEIVVAKVVLKEQKELDKQALIEFCKQQLFHYKVPVRIDIVEELPKSRYGKIRRLTQES